MMIVSPLTSSFLMTSLPVKRACDDMLAYALEKLTFTLPSGVLHVLEPSSMERLGNRLICGATLK